MTVHDFPEQAAAEAVTRTAGVSLAVVPLAGQPAVEGRPAGRLAAIDIGSNSIHMIVVAPDPRGGQRMLSREKEMVRLGRSALRKGALSKTAVARGLEALVKMTTLARLKGADRAVAVATSAVREASNGREFLARVKAQTGLEVTLLTGEEEGLLIHRAVREVVDLSAGTGLIVDVGGGSTEWVVTRDGEPSSVVSLPLGSLRCAGLLSGDPPSSSDLDALRQHVSSVLAELPAAAQVAGKKGSSQGADRVICTSGTALTCAGLVDHLVDRDPGPPSATLREVRLKDLKVVIDHLAGLKRRKIAALPPVGGGPRAESILAGAVLLAELLRAAGADRFEVCDRALREGLVLEALGRPLAGEGEDRRRRQIVRLARRADESVFRHGVETARLATRLFDLTVSIHGLGQRERDWLEYAALVHDVGYSINYRGHHKHSYYLITSAGLDAFDPAEVEIIALVARYHRGKAPKAKRPDLAVLPKWQRKTVMKLAAVLRLADAFDRTHASRVQSLFCAIGKKKLEIELISPYDVSLELETAEDRVGFFEKVFGRKVKLRQGLQRAR